MNKPKRLYLDESKTNGTVWDGFKIQTLIRKDNFFFGESTKFEGIILPFSVGYSWYFLQMNAPWGFNIQRDIIPCIIEHFFPDYKCYTGSKPYDDLYRKDKKALIKTSKVPEIVCGYGAYYCVHGYVDLSKILEVKEYSRDLFYGDHDKCTFNANYEIWDKVTSGGSLNENQKIQTLITHINSR